MWAWGFLFKLLLLPSLPPPLLLIHPPPLPAPRPVPPVSRGPPARGCRWCMQMRCVGGASAGTAHCAPRRPPHPPLPLHTARRYAKQDAKQRGGATAERRERRAGLVAAGKGGRGGDRYVDEGAGRKRYVDEGAGRRRVCVGASRQLQPEVPSAAEPRPQLPRTDRAEPNRSESNRTEPGRAEPSRRPAAPHRAWPSRRRRRAPRARRARCASPARAPCGRRTYTR